MKKSEILIAKHAKHSAFYVVKKEQYLQMEKNSRSLNRLGRLMDLNGQLMQLALDINNALLDELTAELAADTTEVANCDYCGMRAALRQDVVENIAICDTCVPIVERISKDWEPELDGVCLEKKGEAL